MDCANPPRMATRLSWAVDDLRDDNAHALVRLAHGYEKVARRHSANASADLPTRGRTWRLAEVVAGRHREHRRLLGGAGGDAPFWTPSDEAVPTTSPAGIGTTRASRAACARRQQL